MDPAPHRERQRIQRPATASSERPFLSSPTLENVRQQSATQPAGRRRAGSTARRPRRSSNYLDQAERQYEKYEALMAKGVSPRTRADRVAGERLHRVVLEDAIAHNTAPLFEPADGPARAAGDPRLRDGDVRPRCKPIIPIAAEAFADYDFGRHAPDAAGESRRCADGQARSRRTNKREADGVGGEAANGWGWPTLDLLDFGHAA